MPYSQKEWILLFFIYCVMGWIWETLYVSVRKREWVNRGFLYGPWLPIYGSGAIIILLMTLRVRESLPLIFLLGMIGATVLEYVTGAAMERIFHMRYWDYSSQPLNVNGYICLPVSLSWGGFSVLLVKVMHPPVERLVLYVPAAAGEVLVLVLAVLFTVDVTKSVQTAFDLKGVLAKLGENKGVRETAEERLHAFTECLYAGDPLRVRQKIRSAVSLLQRNPSAASRKYKDAFAELKKLKNVRHHK